MKTDETVTSVIELRYRVHAASDTRLVGVAECKVHSMSPIATETWRLPRGWGGGCVLCPPLPPSTSPPSQPSLPVPCGVVQVWPEWRDSGVPRERGGRRERREGGSP